MPLINCLRKVGSFSKEEQEYILNKSKALQDSGISSTEAELRVVRELQQDLINSLKSVYSQLNIETTKKVNHSLNISEKGLKPMRIAYKKGQETIEQEEYDKLSKADKAEYKETVKPAQVIISWNLRDKTGKLVSPDNYIIKDEETGTSYIDTTKVPKEILTQFGFRIPNQGHNSMSLIEVVGFLPDVYAGLVIASRNFITQMGSDFDVDKLYIYNYYLDNDKDGKLSKAENDVHNQLVDVHKSILYNPALFNSVVKPLDLGEIKYKNKSGQEKGIAVDLKKLIEKGRENYLSPDYDKEKYLQSIDGKAMVGITSVSNVFSTLLQGKNVSLQNFKYVDGYPEYYDDAIIFEDENEKPVSYSDLSNPFSRSGRKKNELHQGIQSAAVDNERDPVLSYINANPQTASVLTLMFDLGLEEEAYLFLAQPILKDYVKRVKLSKSNLSEEYITEEQILSDITQQLVFTTEELREKLNRPDLENVPLGVRHYNQVLFNKGVTQYTNEEIQALVFYKFTKLKKFGDALFTVQNLFNIESKGVGKSLLDLASKRNSIDNALVNPLLKNISNVAGELNEGILEPNTITGYGIKNAIYAADDVITNSKLMPFSSELFNKVIRQYENILSNSREATAEQKYEVWKAVKAFNFAKAFRDEERQELFFDSTTNKSLNRRIADASSKLKNNPFILRLDLSKIDLTGKTPSYIYYNSAKEADIEDINVYQGFLDLFYNSAPEIKAIGEDLVKYFYLNGGTPGARDWARYIDNSMLDVLGLTEVIQSVDFNNTDTYGYQDRISEVLTQLFQHKPYLAPRYVTDKPILSEGKLAIPKESIPVELQRVREKGSIVPIVNLNNNLYKITGQNKENYLFEFLPKRGGKFFNEYKNQDSTKEEFQHKDNPKYEATETFVNPLYEERFNGLLGTDLKTSLYVISKSSNNYHAELANLFIALKGIIGDVKVNGLQTEENFLGRFNGEIDVNLTALEKESRLSRDNIELIILKETVHAIMAKMFRGEFNPTSDQAASKRALEDIFNSVRNRIFNDELSDVWDKATLLRYEQLIAKATAGGKFSLASLTAEEQKELRDNKDKYYGLTNVEDFIHDFLLQKGFRAALNSIPYDGNKSLLTRIANLIKAILKQFKSLIDIKSDSTLEEAFNQVINLTQTTKSTDRRLSKEDTTALYDIETADIQEKEEQIYGKIISDFDVRLKSISEDIGRANAQNDKEQAAGLINRYKEVKEERDNLIAENSLESILAIAEKDLQYVEQLQQNPNLSSNDLKFIRLILGTWTKIDNPEIYNVLSYFEAEQASPKREAVKSIVSKAKELDVISGLQEIRIFKNLAEETLDRKLTREEITTVKDVSYSQAVFRDITSSDNILLSTIDKLVRVSNIYMEADLNEVNDNAEKLTKVIQSKGITTREDFSRVYGQVDENGNLTGELVDALTPAYFDTRERLLKNIEEAPNAAERKERGKEYYNWIRDNHIIVQTSKLYTEDKDGILVYTSDEAYLTELEKQLGEDYKEVIANEKQATEKYNQDLRQQINYYKNKVGGEVDLQIWRLANSPLVYIDNLLNGLTVNKVEGNIIYNKGWEYITKRVISSWEDSKYNELQKDSDLKAYYDWYKTTLKNLYNYLPYNIRKELKTTEIPNINKNLVQEIHDAGITKILNRSWSALLDAVSVSKNEKQELIDPATGEFTKSFQFNYLDKLNPQHKSYDLTQVLKLFAAQAIGYKYKAEIEDNVRLAESVLKRSLETQVDYKGKPKTDKAGKTTSSKGLKNLYDQLNYVIEVFYGKKKDTREGVTGLEYITPKDREKLAQEEAAIDALDISEESKLLQKQKVKDALTKKFTWSRFGDTLLQYIQLKGMGWNVFGGVNNVLFGQMANYNWAAASKDFNDSDMNKAVGLMLMAQSPVGSETKDKIEALMVKLNTVKQLRDHVHKSTTNYNKARKGLEKIAPYELYAKGEYFVQGQIMVALLNAQVVEVVEDGITKTIPLYEALDLNGNWNEAKFGKDPGWSDTGKVFINFKLKLDDLLKKIHGNYDPLSAMLINKKWLGRALIQFRRWIPEGMAQRFESEKYNEYLQRNVKGRYSTYYDLGWKQSLKTLLKTAIYRGQDKAFTDLNLEGSDLEIVKENMKKNLRELYYKLSMIGTLLLLSLGDDDDDEYFPKMAKIYMINTIYRLEDDIEFYYSPMAFKNITRSTIPAASLIEDGYLFIEAFLDTLAGEGTYKTGKHSGDSKLLWKGLKVIPFGSAMTSLVNKGETAENFRK